MSEALPISFSFESFRSCLFSKEFKRGFRIVLSLGFTVIVTTIVYLWPCVFGIWRLSDVGRRVFPFGRGIFEDYVGNVWAVMNPVLKLRQITRDEAGIYGHTTNSTGVNLTQGLGGVSDPIKPQSNLYRDLLLKLSLLITVTNAFLAGGAALVKPNHRNFLKALLGSSIAFYLFSWQVHEKAILLPLLPALLQLPLLDREGSGVAWRNLAFIIVGMYSLFGLSLKDKNFLAWAQLMALTVLISSFLVQSDVRFWANRAWKWRPNRGTSTSNNIKSSLEHWTSAILMLLCGNSTLNVHPEAYETDFEDDTEDAKTSSTRNSSVRPRNFGSAKFMRSNLNGQNGGKESNTDGNGTKNSMTENPISSSSPPDFQTLCTQFDRFLFRLILFAATALAVLLGAVQAWHTFVLSVRQESEPRLAAERQASPIYQTLSQALQSSGVEKKLERYPDLFSLLHAMICCGVFVSVWARNLLDVWISIDNKYDIGGNSYFFGDPRVQKTLGKTD